MKLEQVLQAASLCARYGVGAIFNFIVGFPGESDESIEATLSLAKRLRRMHARFETPIFYYRPYPGNPLAERARADGYGFPQGLDPLHEPPPGLGPHCVGLRVVVRRVLPGRTGPSGGPAMTDLLGVMETWAAAGRPRSAPRTAPLTEIALADIVSGKPVPPRPSPRMRVSAEQACRLSNASWPAVHTEQLGDWLLRASGGFSARANSVMAVGDPGRAVRRGAGRAVVAFYAAHGLPAWAQVVVGSETGDRFEDAGWAHRPPR